MFMNRTLEDDHSERVRVVCVPMQELAIKDTWHVAGLCATGSNTIVAGDVFVPEHRVLTVSGDRHRLASEPLKLRAYSAGNRGSGRRRDRDVHPNLRLRRVPGEGAEARLEQIKAERHDR